MSVKPLFDSIRSRLVMLGLVLDFDANAVLTEFVSFSLIELNSKSRFIIRTVPALSFIDNSIYF